MDAAYVKRLRKVGIDPVEAEEFAKEANVQLNAVTELHKENRTGQYEVQIDFIDMHNDFRSFMVGDLLKHILHCRRTAKIPVYDQESDQ